MNEQEVIRGLLYLFLTVLGIPGNLVVIAAFSHIAYFDRKLLPADIIVLHLMVVNLTLVVQRCLFETLASFYVVNIFTDLGCKIVIFVYRTCRALSIWLTFVLSAFQCISIAPTGSKWSSIKLHAPQYLAGVFVFIWILNTFLSVPSVIFSSSKDSNTTSLNHSINIMFCFVKYPSELWKSSVGAVQIARDVVPMTLMLLANIFILVILYRHSKHAKQIRSAKQNQKESAEMRAAKTVVTLVTLYILFFGIDNILWVYTLSISETLATSIISDLRIFFASLYAAVSPIVIILSNRKVNNKLKCVAVDQSPQSCETVKTTV
ncbi:olfactory receptor class A-like protein 1 [Acipenser oxyrinchus oxyrinchus]|uniref:Vomeronasal type-1 receptor n=1 Tax=Acipenser oxyrinchus oxyrinchus TaxID=40147 RepID=A0AAD8FUW5_ACIOX|nr:olfactory receptor class A-like protein 1 [Acipenser oxyrinchus oxyrinchus]